MGPWRFDSDSMDMLLLYYQMVITVDCLYEFCTIWQFLGAFFPEEKSVKIYFFGQKYVFVF